MNKKIRPVRQVNSYHITMKHIIITTKEQEGLTNIARCQSLNNLKPCFHIIQPKNTGLHQCMYQITTLLC